MKTSEGIAVEVELVRRRLTKRAFAARLGVSGAAVRGLLNGSLFRWRLARRVEHMLGCRIWSPPAEFAARQKLAKFFGGRDPLTVSRVQLEALARKVKLRGRSHRRQKDLFLLLAENIAALEAAQRGDRNDQEATAGRAGTGD